MIPPKLPSFPSLSSPAHGENKRYMTATNGSDVLSRFCKIWKACRYRCKIKPKFIQPRSQGPLLLGRVGEDPGNEVEVQSVIQYLFSFAQG